jgi:hypothetical protein
VIDSFNHSFIHDDPYVFLMPEPALLGSFAAISHAKLATALRNH